MASYEISRDGFFYTGESGETQCLISFWDFYANRGTIPLHAYVPGPGRTLPDILRRLQGVCDEPEAMLAVACVFKQSLLGYRPLRVLVSGGSLALKAVLEEAAREAHSESRVHSLEGDGDYLRDAYFDLSVICGEEPSTSALHNMTRATRVGGYLVRVQGGRLDEKQVSPKEHAPRLDVALEMRGLRAKLERVMGEENAAERLQDAISVLREMESLAIRMFDVCGINLKQRLNEAKENAINVLYAKEEDYRAEQLQKLKTHLLSPLEYTEEKNASGGGL